MISLSMESRTQATSPLRYSALRFDIGHQAFALLSPWDDRVAELRASADHHEGSPTEGQCLKDKRSTKAGSAGRGLLMGPSD